MQHFLGPYKRVEAGDGYVGHGDKVKCPANVANLAERCRQCRGG